MAEISEKDRELGGAGISGEDMHELPEAKIDGKLEATGEELKAMDVLTGDGNVLEAIPVGESVTVTYGRKINLGDYNSVDYSVTVGGRVLENEDIVSALERVWDVAVGSVRKQFSDLQSKIRGDSEAANKGGY